MPARAERGRCGVRICEHDATAGIVHAASTHLAGRGIHAEQVGQRHAHQCCVQRAHVHGKEVVDPLGKRRLAGPAARATERRQRRRGLR